MVSPSMLGLLFSWTGVLVVVLSIIHVLICTFLLLVVLLQRGKSGDVMSAFGGPTPSSYAAMSTDDLFSRLTKIGAFSFMGTSLLLALLASQTDRSMIADDLTAETPAEASAPATSAPAPADAMPAPTDAAPAPAEGAPAPAEGAPAPAEGAAAPAEATPAATEPAPAEPAPAGATSTTP